MAEYFSKNTPFGELYAGGSSDSLGRGVYGGLGNNSFLAREWYPTEQNGQTNPLFALAYHGGGEFPENYEGFYNEAYTPLGRFTIGTSDTYPSLGATYEPSDYVMALANLLNPNGR